MAPESINGKEERTKETLWSLGGVLYELCTRKKAFTAPSAAGIVQKIFKSDEHLEVLTSSHYSLELIGLVKSLLQRDPENRPTLKEIESMPFLSEAMSKARSIEQQYDIGPVTPMPECKIQSQPEEPDLHEVANYNDDVME